MNPQGYLDHQLNNSKSKQTYRFSKSTRFQLPKKMATQVFYDKPTTLSKRTCNFGFGNKVQMSINKVSPPPGIYKTSSDFDIKTNRKRKISFGSGRNDANFGSFINQIKRKADIPSPDKYTTTVSKNNKGGLIGIKLSNDYQKKEKKNFPGPGSYKLNAVQMNHSGEYILSNFIQSMKFSNERFPRYFKEVHKRHSTCIDSVSPSQYFSVQNKIGKSVLSKFKNSIERSFNKSIRQGIIDKDKTNGNYYRRFSEFGLHS